MNDDIPYNKAFDLKSGRAEEVAPGVRAIVANNPGPFTFKGTVSYVIGRGKVAILDPGPDDEAHIANHVAYAFRESDLLFSGDHVMAWSTSIVAPPDGAMSDYMDSLAKLARRSEPIYLPGHGGLVREAPRFVQKLIGHREGREAS